MALSGILAANSKQNVSMNPQSVLRQLRAASLRDVFLLTFLILPIVLSSWLTVFEKVPVEGLRSARVLTFLTLVFLLFVFVSYRHSLRLRRARNKIIQVLDREKDLSDSFKGLRTKLKVKWKEPFFREIVANYPDDFCFSRTSPQGRSSKPVMLICRKFGTSDASEASDVPA
jgi:hypothetical protein